MAAVNKDEVDFGKLEKQVLGAIESEARYYRENDAKFRAVNQKVATYEEFRDIVLAAHLKPLAKDDKMPQKFVQPWNTASTKMAGDPSRNPTQGVSAPKPCKVPTTSLALVNDWRRLKTDEEKLNYLLVIGGERLKVIFKTEISGGLLGDILNVLLTHTPDQAGEVESILNALASAKRFKLDLQFMSSKEKETCQKLFQKLRDEGRFVSGEKETSKEVKDSEVISRESGDAVPTESEVLVNEEDTDVESKDAEKDQQTPTMDELDKLMTLFEVTL